VGSRDWKVWVEKRWLVLLHLCHFRLLTALPSH
jgi:hypothetical protein